MLFYVVKCLSLCHHFINPFVPHPQHIMTSLCPSPCAVPPKPPSLPPSNPQALSKAKFTHSHPQFHTATALCHTEPRLRQVNNGIEHILALSHTKVESVCDGHCKNNTTLSQGKAQMHTGHCSHSHRVEQRHGQNVK